MNEKKQLTLYVDTRRCMGCRACEIACKLENDLPRGPRYTMVTETEVIEDGVDKLKFLPVPLGTSWRVVIAPVLTLGTAIVLTLLGVLDFGINDYPALIALFGTPAAVSSAIMAGQMNNDEQLATQIVVWTSLFSIATMFITVCVLMAAGLLAA